MGIFALLLLTLGSSWFAFTMTRFGGVSTLWAANGLLVGALLLTPRATWRWWFLAGALGQVAARVLVGDSWLQVVGLVAANLLECAIVAGWVRRKSDDLRHLRLAVVARDSFGSALVASVVSASIALPIVLARGGTSASVAWLTWFSAHLLGLVIVATLTVVSFQQGVRLLGVPGRRLDYLGCIALLCVGCWIAFGQQSFSLLFLVFLPLLLLSFRHGLTGMVVGILILAGASGVTAAEGMGSFALAHTGSPVERLLYWQVYIACACLISFPTAVAMTERQHLMDREAAARAQLLAITQHLPAMVARFDRDARYLYANERSRGMAAGVDLIGRTLFELRGPAQFEELRPHIEAVLRGESPTFETYLQYPDRRVDLRAQFVPDRAQDGAIQGFYSLSFDITQAKEAERELARQARFDTLTGLANRRHFDESLDAAVALAIRNHAPLVLLSLDLDRFKAINDTLGHAAGDEVLKEFGRRIQASVYEVDLVARLGGDEFVVLVEFSPSLDGAAKIAEHIINEMRTPFVLGNGHELQVATSIGIGRHFPVVSGEALLELADKALYEAKNRGRNTYSTAEG